MKKLLILILVAITNYCIAQMNPNTIYNQDFNWKITIPKTFVSIDADEWIRLRNKAAEAMKKTTGSKIEDRSKGIFVFKSDQLNYFESSYQSFDTGVDVDLVKLNKSVYNLLYQTFKTQMPDAKVDTSFSRETISGLVFDVFKVKETFSDGFEVNMIKYKHFFEKDKKEFSINVMYTDSKKGKLMLDSWRNSTFGD